MSDRHAATFAHHFEDARQEREAVGIGMWAFLAQEVMFFGGLFTVYLVYRRLYPAAFAEASEHLDVGLGALNTAVLILSSLTMALAVRAAQMGRGRACAGFLAATLALGGVFLGVKAAEYSHKFHDHLVPGQFFDHARFSDAGAELFFSLYFVMTGTHALHMVVGMGLLLLVTRRALAGRYGREHHWGVEVLGLYWHFVDVVWIFLFPLLYLIGRHAA